MNTNVVLESTQVGLLTKTGEMNGFILARCSCGYPCVIAPQDWNSGSLMGCAKCNDAELERNQEAKDVEDRIRRAEEKEKAQAAEKTAFWTDPHYDELSPRHKRLFKSLIDTPSFSLSTVAAMTRTMPKEAWDKLLLPLIAAGCLLEQVGFLGQTRQYSDKPYELGCSNSSNYKCRGLAIRQMRDLEAQALAQARIQPEPEPPVRVYSADVLADEVKEFLSARCVTGTGLVESEVLSRARYVSWAEGRKQEALSPDEWYSTLDRLGYARKAGKVLGLRLRKASELMTS